MCELRLRAATLEDLELLRRWDEAPQVVASNPNDDWQWETELGRHLPWREQLIAEVNVTPIGFVEISDPAEEEHHYWGKVGPGLRAVDIWIGEEAWLGRGYGTQIMQLVLRRCFSNPGVEAVIIDPLVSNERAIRFYQRLGFRAVERRWFGLDECLVHRLDRREWCRRDVPDCV